MNRFSLLRKGVMLLFLSNVLACSEQPDATPESARGQWEQVTLNTHADFRDLSFVDDRRGWLVGGAFNTPGGLLAVTEDGGLTWRFTGGPATNDAKSLTAVHFFSEQLGLLGTDRGQILKTTDGGRTWRTRLQLPSRFGNRVTPFVFPSYGVGYATIGGRLVRTEDFGDSWHCLTSSSSRCPAAPQCAAPPAGKDLDLSALAFRTPKDLVAVSQRYSLSASNDGGCSWRTIAKFGNDRAVWLRSVSFADADHGWVVGDEGLVAATTDGGETWETQNPRVGANFRQVVFLDVDSGYLVGERVNRSGSVLLSTVNAGADWQLVQEVSNDLLSALHVNIDGKLWAAGGVVDITKGQRLVRYTP